MAIPTNVCVQWHVVYAVKARAYRPQRVYKPLVKVYILCMHCSAFDAYKHHIFSMHLSCMYSWPVNALSPHISLVSISALSCACMYILKLNQAAHTNCTVLAKKDHVLVREWISYECMSGFIDHAFLIASSALFPFPSSQMALTSCTHAICDTAWIYR